MSRKKSVKNTPQRLSSAILVLMALTILLGGCSPSSSPPSDSEKTNVLKRVVEAVEPTKKNVADEVTNILLLGVDTRSDNDNSNSDTIMLLSYNHDKNEIRLVSFLRDTWVRITDTEMNRLNAANAYGGPEMVMEVLKNNFDLNIDGYAQVKFSDFLNIIDAIGGVDVSLTQEEIDYINGKQHTDDWVFDNDIYDSPGIVHLNGRQALWHCRNRTIGSDFERTERQRTVLRAMVQKVLHEASPTETMSLARQVFPMVNTNLTLKTFLTISKNVISNGTPVIESINIPSLDMVTDNFRGDKSVLVIDFENAKEILENFLTKKWNHVETQW